jgi:glucose/arabinose dehydrogenase
VESMLRERIKLPEGYAFSVFASGLGNPRLMQMTPAGDLIISNMRGGDILLVRADGDGDGRSDGQAKLQSGLDRPHGLLLEGTSLFVAEEERVTVFDFDGAALSNRRVVLDGLPGDGGHSSRTLKRGPDGFLYLAIGSSCNSCVEQHPWRAAILRFKEDGGAPEIYARGLRNTVGFDWQPGTGMLYGVDNGRDNLGDDIPDDEVNRIEPGRHYGWPYVHGPGIDDPDLAASRPAGLTLTPQFHGLGGHVAPLSIRFLRDQPQVALIAEHGSWNRTAKAGYRIIRLVLDGETAREEPFLSGCEENEQVICRPVDILEGADGSLYVTDDYAGAVYRIVKAL